MYTSYRVDKYNQPNFDYITKKLRRNQMRDDDSEIYDDDVASVDLTHVFQDILWNYHDLFGCKSLCFHPKSSPFYDLQNVVKSSKYDVYLPKTRNCENVLCLVYMSDGIKRVFTAYYDNNHKLIGVDSGDQHQAQYEGVEYILQQNKYFCNIENYPKSITKEEFIYSAGKVPYFSDFMRSETILRVEDLDDTTAELNEELDNNLTVNILDRKQQPIVTVEFIKNNKNISYDTKKGTLRISLPPAYKLSSLFDIGERVKEGINIVRAEYNTGDPQIDQLDFNKHFWDFKKNGAMENTTLSHNLELDDITYSEGYELVYFPVKSCSELNRNPPASRVGELSKYDCYCIISEIGATKQWVP